MEKYTEAPYHLTLKSNGCLILISALSPSHLLIASKHSLGTTPEQDPAKDLAAKAGDLLVSDKRSDKGKEKEKDAGEAEDRTHASVGREWVRRTLKAKGKTEAELARRLWDQNLSAVLEVCQAMVQADNSYATTRLRSTSLPHPNIGPDFICTVSTITLLTSPPCLQTTSLLLPPNSASSLPKLSNSILLSKSGRLPMT